MTQAIRIIAREHRDLVALLSCFKGVVRDAEKNKTLPDFDLLELILDYLGNYLNRYHHPKETSHLFPALRRQRPDLAPVLDQLEWQHEKVEPTLAKLRSQLNLCRNKGSAHLSALRDAVERYAMFEMAHIGLEEREIMPAATQNLSESDWRDINAAFADNDDPLFGRNQKKMFRRLYGEIVARSPAPHGLGAQP